MKDNTDFGNFISFVLLSKPQWDSKQFIRHLKKEWNIEFSPSEKNSETLVEKFGDGFITVSFIPTPIPGDEAENYAKANYLWPDAEKQVKSHKAYILVAVTGNKDNILEKAKITTKLVDACLKQDNVVAVYADGAVYQPRLYHQISQVMRDGDLPVPDWIWFGIARSGETHGIYTYGMRKFGKNEIEVYAKADIEAIRNFVIDLAYYVIEYDVTLNDGETIGFSEDEALTITLSKGIALDGETLKIQYPQ